MPDGPIRVATVTKTCEAFPAQWEGRTDDDRPVYVRFRYGYGSVHVGDVGASGDDILPEAFGFAHGGGFCGELSYDELKEHTAERVEWPDKEGA